MFQVDETQLTPAQRGMLRLWEQHLAAEFDRRDAVESCDTMTANPSVNHVPVLTGGHGRRQLQHFYGRYFIPQMPADLTLAPLSRRKVTEAAAELAPAGTPEAAETARVAQLDAASERHPHSDPTAALGASAPPPAESR